MPISTSVKLLINFHQCLIVSETIGEAPTIIFDLLPSAQTKSIRITGTRHSSAQGYFSTNNASTITKKILVEGQILLLLFVM